MSIDHQNSASYFMRNVKVKFLRTHLRNLDSVFSIYPYVHIVVSVESILFIK